MPHGSTAHEVLAVVFQVRGLGAGPKTHKPELSVLLWQRARDPQKGAWSLPGGQLRHDEVPIADAWAAQELSLPLHPVLEPHEIERVAEAVHAAVFIPTARSGEKAS
jgi:hypothetical protein